MPRFEFLKTQLTTYLILTALLCPFVPNDVVASAKPNNKNIFLNTSQAELMLVDRKRSFSSRRRNFVSSSYKIDEDDTDDENYAKSVVQKLYDSVDIDDGIDVVMDRLDDASDGQVAVYSITMMQNQVNNGGFDMYLFSRQGNLINEVREGLQLIGADGYLKIVDKVLALFANDKESITSQSARQKVLNAIPKFRRESVLDRLDEEFYSLELQGLLDTHMEYFIRKHPDQFFQN